MITPNVFNFATSELSQDAVLAYILSWARPGYQNRYPELNRLGDKLLRLLVEKAATKKGIQNPLDKSEPVTELKVGTQRDRIDVWAEINDRWFLVIEDKTETNIHSRQLERYCSKIDSEKWIVLPVYVKTGNECKRYRPDRKSVV